MTDEPTPSPADEAARIRMALADHVHEEHIDWWLSTPNPRFGGRTPARVIEDGEAWRIDNMMRALDASCY